jgi:hypothetical protein
MQGQILKADFVVLVCTETYFKAGGATSSSEVEHYQTDTAKGYEDLYRHATNQPAPAGHHLKRPFDKCFVASRNPCESYAEDLSSGLIWKFQICLARIEQ